MSFSPAMPIEGLSGKTVSHVERDQSEYDSAIYIRIYFTDGSEFRIETDVEMTYEITG